MNELTREQLLQEVESLTIHNNGELENANELAKECGKHIKEIKETFKPQKQELDKQKKGILSQEKESLKPFETGKEIIKKAILTYHQQQEQLRLEQQKVAEEEKEEFGFAVSEVQETPKLKGTHIRKKWKARVVDIDKVPINFRKMVIRPVDEKKLNDIAVFEEGQAEIPGIEFYQEENVVVR